MEWLALGLAAFSALFGEYRAWRARADNKANQKALNNLEENKVDLSVAELGHEIFMDLVSTLRKELEDCHQERDAFRKVLEDQGLIPKSGM